MLRLPAQAVRFTPEDAHCFFGYYDIPAFSRDCRRHLYLRVPFMDRMQEKGDAARLFVHDFATGKDKQFAETTAWNFQQACMLQWHPTRADTVIYNVRTEGEGGGYGARVQSLETGEVAPLDRPVANVSPTGRHAVSISFDRMFDFRPGYGYAGQRDAFFDVPHPREDGVFLIDLETGRSRLVVSLERIWQFAGGFFRGEDQKICINHITFNADGTRLVFLVRNFYDEHSTWHTAILTCDIEGKELFLLSDFAMASHYNWRDDRVIAFYSDGRELGGLGPQLYELTDLTHEGRAVDPEFFVHDGHVSYSPDREWILYDSHIFENSSRRLYLYDLKTRRGGLLGNYKVPQGCVGDIRCDLHPVWAPDSRTISFDSVHEGFRGVYRMDLTQAEAALRRG